MHLREAGVGCVDLAIEVDAFGGEAINDLRGGLHNPYRTDSPHKTKESKKPKNNYVE